ncbi:MAG: hypothetical protein K2X69_14870 [Silvanigrellaceae bacterium]|nr:hypothetical protein [Silvanigrellaceae bacterium]
MNIHNTSYQSSFIQGLKINNVQAILNYIDNVTMSNFSDFSGCDNQEIKNHFKKLDLVLIEIVRIIFYYEKRYKKPIKELFLNCFDNKNFSNLIDVEKLFNSYEKESISQKKSLIVAKELKILEGQSNKQILEELLEEYDKISEKYSVSPKIINETSEKLLKILEIYSK